MKIILAGADGKKSGVELQQKATVKDLASKCGISAQAFLFCRNGELCLEEEQLKEGDLVELVRVVSGG